MVKNVLRRKLVRDMWHNRMQFLAVILLCALGTWVFSGLDAAWRMLDLSAQTYFDEQNVADVWITLSSADREALERVRGIGTLVNRGALAVRRRLDRKLEFTQMILAAGRTPHTDHLVVTRQQPDDATAAALGLCAAQTVLVVGKRLLADDRTVLYCTDFISLALFPGERVDGIDFTRPIFSILQEHCGIETTTAVTRLHAVRGDAAARRLLGCGPESALLELEETCYSHLCRPVLRSRTLYTDYLDLAFVRRLSG